MATQEDKVYAQHELFKRQIPELVKAHRGQWVVFLDTPRKFLPDSASAGRWADENLKPGDCYVLAPVEPIEPVLVTAAFAYRLGT